MIVGNIFSALWTLGRRNAGVELAHGCAAATTCVTKLQWIELDGASAVMPVRRTRPGMEGMDYEEGWAPYSLIELGRPKAQITN